MLTSRRFRSGNPDAKFLDLQDRGQCQQPGSRIDQGPDQLREMNASLLANATRASKPAVGCASYKSGFEAQPCNAACPTIRSCRATMILSNCVLKYYRILLCASSHPLIWRHMPRNASEFMYVPASGFAVCSEQQPHPQLFLASSLQ